MNLDSAVTSFSKVLSYTVPTVTQAAGLGTVASVCMILLRAAIIKSSCLLNYGGTTSYCVLLYTAPLTLVAAAHKKSPLLSQIGLLGTLPFALKLYAKYIALSQEEDQPFPMYPAFYHCLVVAVGINLITTGILVYQQPSLARAIHFAGSLVLPIRCFMFSR